MENPNDSVQNNWTQHIHLKVFTEYTDWNIGIEKTNILLHNVETGQ